MTGGLTSTPRNDSIVPPEELNAEIRDSSAPSYENNGNSSDIDITAATDTNVISGNARLDLTQLFGEKVRETITLNPEPNELAANSPRIQDELRNSRSTSTAGFKNTSEGQIQENLASMSETQKEKKGGSLKRAIADQAAFDAGQEIAKAAATQYASTLLETDYQNDFNAFMEQLKTNAPQAQLVNAQVRLGVSMMDDMRQRAEEDGQDLSRQDAAEITASITNDAILARGGTPVISNDGLERRLEEESILRDTQIERSQDLTAYLIQNDFQTPDGESVFNLHTIREQLQASEDRLAELRQHKEELGEFIDRMEQEEGLTEKELEAVTDRYSAVTIQYNQLIENENHSKMTHLQHEMVNFLENTPGLDGLNDKEISERMLTTPDGLKVVAAFNELHPNFRAEAMEWGEENGVDITAFKEKLDNNQDIIRLSTETLQTVNRFDSRHEFLEANFSISDLMDKQTKPLEDKNGNLVYSDPDTQKLYHLKLDENGDVLKDENGNVTRVEYDNALEIAELRHAAWNGEDYRHFANETALSKDPDNRFYHNIGGLKTETTAAVIQDNAAGVEGEQDSPALNKDRQQELAKTEFLNSHPNPSLAQLEEFREEYGLSDAQFNVLKTDLENENRLRGTESGAPELITSYADEIDPAGAAKPSAPEAKPAEAAPQKVVDLKPVHESFDPTKQQPQPPQQSAPGLV